MVLNRSLILTAVAAGALFAIGGTAAQAQTFTYSNVTTPDPFTGTNGAIIDVLNTSSSIVRNTTGTTTVDIVLFNLNNISTNTAANPGAISTSYSTLVSFTSGGQTLTGTVTGNFAGSNVSNTTGDYSSSVTGTSPNPLTFTFTNGNSVALGNFTFTAPPPSGGGFGAVGATATLNVVSTGTNAPEPGSLALLGTSALGVTGMVIRRRRAK